MKVYYVFDKDPDGGHYSFVLSEPVIKDFKSTTGEIRIGDMTPTMYVKFMTGEVTPDEDYTFDSILKPYFDKASPWWKKGGD